MDPSQQQEDLLRLGLPNPALDVRNDAFCEDNSEPLRPPFHAAMVLGGTVDTVNTLGSAGIVSSTLESSFDPLATNNLGISNALQAAHQLPPSNLRAVHNRALPINRMDSDSRAIAGNVGKQGTSSSTGNMNCGIQNLSHVDVSRLSSTGQEMDQEIEGVRLAPQSLMMRHHTIPNAETDISSVKDQEPVRPKPSPTKIDRERRKKRRRKLHKLLKRPGVVPSFMAILEQSVVHVDENNNDDEDSDILEPPIVVIDVDEYLGLKKKMASQPDGALSSSQLCRPPAVVSSWAPPPTIDTTNPFNVSQRTMDPAEEGYYEGCVRMRMPEDEHYLTDLQQLVRMNLEYFSANELDVRMSQSGRRLPTVRGKVGVRCIHCARVVHAKIQKVREQSPDSLPKLLSSKSLWPAGSVSYPVTISGMYSVCSQKPQLHFETCPNFPMPVKARLHEILQQSRSNQAGSDGSVASTAKRKRNDGTEDDAIDNDAKIVSRMVSGMSALMYYTIAAQRIGVVEITATLPSPGSAGGSTNRGLRFGRDLALEPLPFSTIRAQVEREHPELLPKRPVFGGQGSSSHVPGDTKSASSSPGQVPSSSQALSAMTAEAASAAVAARAVIRADAESEQVLADFASQEDAPEKFVSRRSDKDLVSDYMFLAVRQMLICHVTKADFLTRGKKTKSMRLGFAGFCCRHCGSADKNDGTKTTFGIGTDYSCRSFSSAPDNLASAISNSFVLHLQRCPKVPVALKKALVAYKKLHTRQMQTFVYGSQRHLFHQIWQRLRAADLPLSVSATEEALKVAPTNNGEEAWKGEEHDNKKEIEPLAPSQQSSAGNPIATTAELDACNPVASVSEGASTDASDVVVVDSERENARIANFPVSADPATQEMLKKYESGWDPAENDHLITPADRHLVSDYVFLTMRQLKIAIPREADFRGKRRNNVIARMAGMCCRNCNLQKETVHEPLHAVPAGRSFPSAPDNMASALNSFFFNHMQNCYNVSVELKRALSNLRKIHSAQCASLMFGSQRRFFGRVSEKLKSIPIGNHPAHNVDKNNAQSPRGTSTTITRHKGAASRSLAEPQSSRVSALDPSLLSRYCFARGNCYAQCLRCRMVAFELRAPGSLFLDNTAVSEDLESSIRKHHAECMEDGLHLEAAAHALFEALTAAFYVESGEPEEMIIKRAAEKMYTSVEFPRLIGSVLGGQRELTRLFSQEIFLEPALKRHFCRTPAKSMAVIRPADVNDVVGAPLPSQQQQQQQDTLAEDDESRIKCSWQDIPTSAVEVADVEASFEAFAKEVGLSWSHQLRDNAKMVRFFQIISPYFNFPSPCASTASTNLVRANADSLPRAL